MFFRAWCSDMEMYQLQYQCQIFNLYAFLVFGGGGWPVVVKQEWPQFPSWKSLIWNFAIFKMPEFPKMTLKPFQFPWVSKKRYQDLISQHSYPSYLQINDVEPRGMWFEGATETDQIDHNYVIQILWAWNSLHEFQFLENLSEFHYFDVFKPTCNVPLLILQTRWWICHGSYRQDWKIWFYLKPSIVTPAPE